MGSSLPMGDQNYSNLNNFQNLQGGMGMYGIQNLGLAGALGNFNTPLNQIAGLNQLTSQVNLWPNQ